MQGIARELMLALVHLDRAGDAFHQLEPSHMTAAAYALNAHAIETVKSIGRLLKQEKEE